MAICDSVYAILKRREDPMSLKRAEAIKERSEQYMRDELDAALLRAEMENAYQDCNGNRYRVHDSETFLCHYCKHRIRKDAPSYHLCEEMKPGIYR
jgi:hypothetical protein